MPESQRESFRTATSRRCSATHIKSKCLVHSRRKQLPSHSLPLLGNCQSFPTTPDISRSQKCDTSSTWATNQGFLWGICASEKRFILIRARFCSTRRGLSQSGPWSLLNRDSGKQI